jgi:hypothetical protein
VKASFIKFIDQNCECLCPIILTTNMYLELEYEEEPIECVVVLEKSPVGISSSLFLNDLVHIEVEVTSEIIKRPKLESLSARKFNVDPLSCKYIPGALFLPFFL